MNTINAINPKVDLSVRVFDSFYSYEEFVPSEEYDVVFSFFKSIFTEPDAAGNFTIALFRIASTTNTPVLTLLAQMEGQDQMNITKTLAYYLNNLRSPATLLGFGATVTPNYYTARNVKP
jgi:hypothetical protein